MYGIITPAPSTISACSIMLLSFLADSIASSKLEKPSAIDAHSLLLKRVPSILYLHHHAHRSLSLVYSIKYRGYLSIEPGDATSFSSISPDTLHIGASPINGITVSRSLRAYLRFSNGPPENFCFCYLNSQ